LIEVVNLELFAGSAIVYAGQTEQLSRLSRPYWAIHSQGVLFHEKYVIKHYVHVIYSMLKFALLKFAY